MCGDGVGMGWEALTRVPITSQHRFEYSRTGALAFYSVQSTAPAEAPEPSRGSLPGPSQDEDSEHGTAARERNDEAEVMTEIDESNGAPNKVPRRNRQDAERIDPTNRERGLF